MRWTANILPPGPYEQATVNGEVHPMIPSGGIRLGSLAAGPKTEWRLSTIMWRRNEPVFENARAAAGAAHKDCATEERKIGEFQAQHIGKYSFISPCSTTRPVWTTRTHPFGIMICNQRTKPSLNMRLKESSKPIGVANVQNRLIRSR
jgi:hypothetical protein